MENHYFLEGEHEQAEVHLLRALRLKPNYQRWGKAEKASEFSQALLDLNGGSELR